MAYDPADLRLPPWLLRLLDVVVRLRLPVWRGWRLGVTRPGALFVGALFGVWGAALYSGNNLLYLCGAMLTTFAGTGLAAGTTLLLRVPPLARQLPQGCEAGAAASIRRPVPLRFPFAAHVSISWRTADGAVGLALALRRREARTWLVGRTTLPARGVHDLEWQRLASAAPLGLWQLERRRREPCAWIVLPRAVPWDGRGGDDAGGDRAGRHEGDEWRDLREYVPGDPVSRVHWRKSMLAGEMLGDWTVKRFGSAERRTRSTRLRVDLRLPRGADAVAFEVLLGRALYWLRERPDGTELILGAERFRLSDAGGREAALRALAAARPEANPPAGEGGTLLSLVESGRSRRAA